MSNAMQRAMARAGVAANATQGNKIVSYAGHAGAVTTVGFIDRADELFGGGVQVSDARRVATLLTEDVGAPHKGDQVTDEEGVLWVLLEQQPTADDFLTQWTVERK